MKKIVVWAIVAVLAVSSVVFIPQILHTCDDCEQVFFGVGYEPNVVENILSNKEQIICKGCAEKQHAVAIALGKSIEEYKRELFD